MFSLWNPHSKVLRSSAGWIIDIQFSRKLQLLSRLVRCIQEEASVVVSCVGRLYNRVLTPLPILLYICSVLQNIARPAADMVLGASMQSHPAGLWGHIRSEMIK